MIDQATFHERCGGDDRAQVYLRRRPGRVDYYLPGIYRMFASWIEEGDEAGPHLRAEGEGTSSAFRQPHNFFHRPKLKKGKALHSAIEEARRVAAMRGGGRPVSGELPDVYKPLRKALEQLAAPPDGLHAGGPRAKVLSGEQQIATLLCERCRERMRDTARDDEAELLERLDKLREQEHIPYERLWPAANAVPYGSAREQREAEEAESAAVQATRAILGCRYGSQKCNPFVTKALLRTTRDLEQLEGPEAASAFIVELDELILGAELEAAVAAKAKRALPAPLERVLWRGADAKGFPAWWLGKLEDGSYVVLGKQGRRWGLERGDWDSALALIPDEHFELAVETASERDGGSS